MRSIQDPALLHTVVDRAIGNRTGSSHDKMKMWMCFLRRMNITMSRCTGCWNIIVTSRHWSFLEFMMDEIVSFWTASNNDLEQMNFFKKQTMWIKAIASSYQIDPRRLISDVLLWTQLYPEIKDEVKGLWLQALCVFASDDLLQEEILHVIGSISEGIEHPQILAEIEFAYKLYASVNVI
jgi:hypothetical protein